MVNTKKRIEEEKEIVKSTSDILQVFKTLIFVLLHPFFQVILLFPVYVFPTASPFRGDEETYSVVGFYS